MPHVLITGAAGFVGMHLALHLAQQGYAVTGLDAVTPFFTPLKFERLKAQGFNPDDVLYNKQLISGIYANLSFIQLDLTDFHALEKFFRHNRFDVLVHLAAQTGVRYSVENPQIYVQNNILSTVNLFECCRQYSETAHVLYASSSSVYGATETHAAFAETIDTNKPLSVYAATKKSSELLAHVYAHNYGIAFTGMRFFTVYGPYPRPDMAAYLFTKAIMEERPIKVFNYGHQDRDFTYIADIVQAITALIKLPPPKQTAPHRVVNIGNEHPVQLLQFIECLQNAIGKKAILELLPAQAGDVSHTFADTTQLYRLTGFKPFTPLETGIKQLVAWCKQYPHL